jgi:hypothetical protein
MTKELKEVWLMLLEEIEAHPKEVTKAKISLLKKIKLPKLKLT